MKTYRTQQEVEQDIKSGVLAIDGDVRFECSISISASIIVTCGNIDARNITAWDINTGNITAENIDARNITAWNIATGDLLYYAFCGVYKSIRCISIIAKREIHKEPICLGGKLEYKQPELNQ